MNQKVTVIIVVILVVALCVLAVIYAPSLGEIIRRIHPSHAATLTSQLIKPIKNHSTKRSRHLFRFIKD